MAHPLRFPDVGGSTHENEKDCSLESVDGGLWHSERAEPTPRRRFGMGEAPDLMAGPPPGRGAAIPSAPGTATETGVMDPAATIPTGRGIPRDTGGTTPVIGATTTRRTVRSTTPTTMTIRATTRVTGRPITRITPIRATGCADTSLRFRCRASSFRFRRSRTCTGAVTTDEERRVAYRRDPPLLSLPASGSPPFAQSRAAISPMSRPTAIPAPRDPRATPIE